MARVARSDILTRLRAISARGEPIIGAGAGTGISAKGEEDGGADLIVIYNSGRYRMAGRGSLAVGGPTAPLGAGKVRTWSYWTKPRSTPRSHPA